MYRQLKNDGFTLVEIIVSISIGSVILGVILSIILMSFNTFGIFSTKKLKKDVLDNIVEYVRGEIQNSTDVIISNIPPKLSTTRSGDWKWLAVDEGRLYYGTYTYDKDQKKGTGNGKLFLNDSYYNSKDAYDKDNSQTNLSVKYSKKTSSKAGNAASKVRVVTLHYTLSNSSEKYKKNDAIEFSNVSEVDTLTSLNRGDLRSLADIEDKDAVSLDNTSTNTLKSFTDNDKNITRLYYQKNTNIAIDDDDDNNPSLTHTVADKIFEMTANSNRGYYVGSAYNFQDSNDENFYKNPTSTNSYNIPLANSYRSGDFVYYKGNWWLLMSANNDPQNNAPQNGGSGIWQCLDGQFHLGNTYNYGDVVLYNNVYYKYLGDSATEWNPPTNSETDKESNPENKLWLNLGTSKPSQNGYDTSFSHLANGQGADAIKQKTPSGSPALDSLRSSIPGVTNYSIKYDTSTVPIYNSNTFDTSKYAVGSLIQVEVKNSGDSNGNNTYYRLYKKIFEPAEYISDKDKVPGNSFLSGWELLENEYMPSSSYTSGATLRLGTSNLNNLSTTADYIRVKTPGSNTNITFDYYDTKKRENNRAIITLTPLDVCSSEAIVYFGLKYNYFDEKFYSYLQLWNNINGYITSYTYNNKQIKQFVLKDVDFNYSSVTGWNSSDWGLTKAMIYLPKESSQTDPSQTNKEVRDQIWERVSLNDMGE